MSNLFNVCNVVKKFKKKEVLKEISFTISQYEYVGLLGNNGCGKSTTVHTMCNLLSYDSGDIFYKGKRIDPKYISYKSELGILLSKPYYIEEFDIETYWRFVCKYQFVPSNLVDKRISDMVKLLDMEACLKQPIKKLSSGNQMKVSIGSALIHNPGMLILDEPFVNLDVGTSQKLKAIFLQLKGKKTLFITSHHIDLIVDLCDRFLVMDNGQIVDDILKSEYPRKDDLKADIERALSKQNQTVNLDWLN